MKRDGPYFSPDGGHFWAKGNQFFWEDGEITSDDICIRFIPLATGENYSLWSADKRAEVQREWAEKCALYAQKTAAEEKRVQALRANARAKLTVEEIAACDLD
jgi:hypothetical protein